MKIFLSHKFTDVGFDELESYLGPIKSSLEKQGHEVFCSLYLTVRFDSLWRDDETRYMYCLEQQKQCDLVVGVIWQDTDSYGMRRELDQAKQDKQRYVLIVRLGLEILDFVHSYRYYASVIVIVDAMQESWADTLIID